MKAKNLFLCLSALLISMMLILISVSSVNKDNLLQQNVEALTDGENSVGDIVRNVLGCPGGEKKCFSGSITIHGIEISGTFYLE